MSVLPADLEHGLGQLRLRATLREATRKAPPWEHPKAPALLDDGCVWIYFVQAGEDGPIKIGSTLDLERRVRSLQTASPVALELRAAVRATPMHEGELHDRFNAVRLHGEWFEATPELLAHIAEVSA